MTPTGTLSGKRILVTGPTGMVAKPVCRSFAKENEVYAAARFSDAGAKEDLEAAGVTCVSVDLTNGDLSQLPDQIDYVCNFAVVKSNRWDIDLEANVGGLGLLMEWASNAGAQAFFHCSSGACYAVNPHTPLKEDAPLGDNHAVFTFMSTYSISKIGAEAMARYAAKRFNLPTTIARLNVPYGDDGGWPAIHLEMMLGGMAVPVHTDAPTSYNLLHADDIVATVPRLLEIATVPATIVNWAGDDVVSIEEWVAYLSELTGLDGKTEQTAQTLASNVMDLTKMHELVGRSSVPWRDGVRRLVEARHPELLNR
ncbi:MAG TPA: NAD(P)-dependent oxidoreductase [Acidimicrobiales bacterium]|jgi:nucleoside-diphosphate-sugar epimerase